MFNVRTIFVTLYPNFNIPLKDPNLPATLKIQMQITGAPMVKNAYAATMHTQFIDRL